MQGSNDTTHRLSRMTAATTRFSPESIGCQKQMAPRFCQHPIRWAFTSQAFARWRHLSTHPINRPATQYARWTTSKTVICCFILKTEAILKSRRKINFQNLPSHRSEGRPDPWSSLLGIMDGQSPIGLSVSGKHDGGAEALICSSVASSWGEPLQ